MEQYGAEQQKVTTWSAIRSGSVSGGLRFRIQGGEGSQPGGLVTDDNAGDGIAGRRESTPYRRQGRKSHVLKEMLVPSIDVVVAREILDSRGNPTVEVEVGL